MVKFLDSATTLEVTDIVVSEAFYRNKLGFGAGHFFGEPPTFCIRMRMPWSRCGTPDVRSSCRCRS